MTVRDGHLDPAPATTAERVPSVTDRLFNSLAEHYGDHAVGIVLSGTGADGALGLKVIKERGGLTIAQGEDATVPLSSGMKYRFLSKETGHVEVTWVCDPQNREDDMTWIVRGGPEPLPPTGRGFGIGMRRLERQLSYELGGTSEVDFAADGLAVTMHIPRLETQETEKAEEAES